MKKRIIVTAAITACLALCAAVWPQPGTREERPAPIPTCTVTAPKADAATRAEKKNTETLRAEPVEELGAVPVPAPAEPTSVAEMPQLETELPAPQPTIEMQPGDEVYIPGFGWEPYEGPNHREYAADMYENGNKIGSMG